MLILLLGIIGSAALLAATSREVGVCDTRRPIHALLGMAGMSLGLCSAAILADGLADSMPFDSPVYADETAVAETETSADADFPASDSVTDETETPSRAAEPTDTTTASDDPEPEGSKAETDVTIVETPEPKPVDATAPADSATSGSSAEPIEIKAPISSPVYPSDWPAWANDPPVRKGPLHSTVVSSGPSAPDLNEWRHTLRIDAKRATDEYIDWYLGHDGASTFVSYDAEDILNRYADPDKAYGGTIQFSIGPMKEEVRVLNFDESFRNELDDRWAKVVATTRISTTALGFGAILSLIAVAFGYFKSDTATKGYYTSRLQFGAATAILTVIVAGVLLARWIPWL